MKRKILSVLGVLMALTALAACEKTPAGADSSEKKVVLIDDEYQIDFSPLEITPQARRSLS